MAPSSAPATCPVSLGSVLSSPEVPKVGCEAGEVWLAIPGGGLRSHLYLNTPWDLRKTLPHAERPLLSSPSGAGQGKRQIFRSLQL